MEIEKKYFNPLAEVFGFPIINETTKAKRYRDKTLCPFHNRVPNCTKDKANNPLGVCSIFHNEMPVITCPIIHILQNRLDEQLEGISPDAPCLTDIISS